MVELSGQNTGAELIARSLQALGIKTVFGVTGYPVTAVLEQCIDVGIKYIGFRNEQAASYAATAYGYLTGKPGCVIVVGGPGVVHAMAGVINSSANCFPLLLLAGSCESFWVGKGSFQELDAISLLTPHVKVALRPHSLDAIPTSISHAYRSSWYGRPGTGFVDLPADFIQHSLSGTKSAKMPQPLPQPARSFPDEINVAKIAQMVKAASSPLVIIGKGSAYARAEIIIRKLLDSTNIPFGATPMGKGVMPDSHSSNVSAARATAYRHADIVLVLGARLNWQLHFGEAPKWNARAIIQVDIDPDVMGKNGGDGELGVVADVNIFCAQLLSRLQGWQYSDDTPFQQMLALEKKQRRDKLAVAAKIKTEPLKFEHAYHIIRTTLDSLSPPSDGTIVYIAEGARTMDLSRAWFSQEHPRLILDAGTHGTMGVGLGYAIAAWEAFNGPQAEAFSGERGKKKVVGLIGDSAFGFAAMELETMARCGMDCLIFVMNNGGVYFGHANSKEEWLAQQAASKEGRGADGLRSWSLGWETRYDMLAESVGGKGFLVRNSEQLHQAVKEGFKAKVPVIVNVLLESGKGNVPVFGFNLSGKTEESNPAPNSKL